MRDYHERPVTVDSDEVDRASERFYERERNRIEADMFKQKCRARTGKSPRQHARDHGYHVPYEKRVAEKLAHRRKEKTHGAH